MSKDGNIQSILPENIVALKQDFCIIANSLKTRLNRAVISNYKLHIYVCIKFEIFLGFLFFWLKLKALIST